MTRNLLIVGLLLTIASLIHPAVLRAWKENGYIGSCAARGCMGRRSLCSVYSFDGGDTRFYCYLDQ